VVGESTGGQPAGSKVLMADGGWKEIQHVAVGDLVLSPQPDGTVMTAPVLAVAMTPQQPIYRLEARGRFPRGYRCTGAQRLPVLVRDQYRDGDRHRMRTARKVVTVDQFLTQSATFQRYTRVFSTPALEFPEANLPVHPYIVGCLLGNGCLRDYPHQNIELVMRRRITFARMRRFGAQFGKMSYRNSCYRVRLVGPFGRLVKHQPYYGTGSHTKFVPEAYKRASLEQRRWLLAGLIDSDGQHHRFSSTSCQLARDVADLVHTIGGSASLKTFHRRRQGEPYVWYEVYYATVEVSIPVQIGYKRRPASNTRWKNRRHHTFSLKPDGRADVYTFTLASPSQWYITDDWLVTQASGQAITAETPGLAAGRSMIPVQADP
jgi:phosphate starvation-inducible protein PhoH and related proteins